MQGFFKIQTNKQKQISGTKIKSVKKVTEYQFIESNYSVYDKITVLLNENDIELLLKRIIEEKPEVIFDYETNALSPYKINPIIHSIGISFEDDKAYSFPWQHKEFDLSKNKKIVSLWKEILSDKNIPLINQNILFEDKWSRVLFTAPSNWVWDTMVNQHIISSAPGTVGLKYQANIRWGIGNYEAPVAKYKTSKEENGDNKLSEINTTELCKYNAIDALVTRKLYLEQKSEFRRNRFLSKGRELFHNGLLAFCDIESNGICVDSNFYEKEEKELTSEINSLTGKLMNSVEALEFKKVTGEEIKLGSSKDLKKLLFDLMKLIPTKTTEKGSPSTDKESLEEINIPFTNKLVQIRKLLKIRDTYLAQFKRNDFNGKIHPSFNLHVARTYRSSCSNPNFQNIPIRDKLAKRVTRGGIIPSKGNKLLEVDFSSIEVRIAACHTNDPELIKYIHDSTTDMHYDQSKLLFLIDDNEMTTDIRFCTKNCFVFPEFYGSWYKNCAINLWEEAKNLKTALDIPLIRHLRSKKINNYQSFENHVKETERIFWKKFFVFKEWQEQAEQEYFKNLYVDMFFGFRRSGILSKNEIMNSPIQGTAFHCLLWSLIEIHKQSIEENWKTKIIGQIHDSIVFDLVPEEQERVLKVVKEIMCERIREEHPFLLVPLEVESEITKINGSWNEKEEIK